MHPSHYTKPKKVPLIVVRQATIDDVDAIKQLVDVFTKTGDLLPRSKREIMITVGDWVLAEADGVPVGIGSLLMYTPQLAEVRSLAVSDKVQGLGVGRKIVAELVALAKKRDVPTVFALTRAVGFFVKIGFEITEKERFPQKIYHACRICPLKDNCDETAVVMELHK